MEVFIIPENKFKQLHAILLSSQIYPRTGRPCLSFQTGYLLQHRIGIIIQWLLVPITDG